MRDDFGITGPAPYRIVILTLDSHAAGPIDRARDRLARDFPGLVITVHAAAEWGENPAALSMARADIASADMILANLLFLGLAFALGVGYQRLNSVESQTARTTVLVEQQAEIIRQNARRLDLLDQSLADFEIDRLRRP